MTENVNTKLSFVVSYDTYGAVPDVEQVRKNIEAHFKAPGPGPNVTVSSFNEFSGVLMQQGYPTGWKLEDLCDQLTKELIEKTQKIAMNRDLGSLTCVANNLQITDLLEVIKKIQQQTMLTFKCVHGEDQGPMRTPRVPKSEVTKYRVVTMAELCEGGNMGPAIHARFEDLRSQAKQNGKLIELRLGPADLQKGAEDPRKISNYRTGSRIVTTASSRIVLTLQSGEEIVFKDV